MITVSGLEKSFGSVRALRGINFRIEQGEYAALLGINGAGKTTLIRILATLSRPTSGAAVLAGVALDKEPNRIREQIGVMSHSTFLYGDLSAEENLRFYGKMYGVSRLSARIDELLQRVGLDDRRHDLVRTFSRGMQQRLSLARAILHHPKILLLDEPFTGLDIHAAALVTELLQQFISEGITVLLTTHDIDYALEHARRVLIIKKGLLASDAATDQLSRKQVSELLENKSARRS
jgi:heme exporter protein A